MVMTNEIEGVIVKIDNEDEPPLVHIREKDGKISVYSIDDIEIINQKGKNVVFEPFKRDKS